MNILDRIEAYADELTALEGVTAQHIKDNYPHCLLDSATRLAQDLGISAATVVRFFAKLNYASFREVQQEVRSELSHKESSPALRAAVPLNQNSVAAILDDVVAQDKQNIDFMRAAIDVAELEQVVGLLSTHSSRRCVYIAGAKNSRSLASYLATHLRMCMPNVYLLPDDAGLLADSMMWVKPNDLLFAFSIRRYSRTIVHTAQHFKKLGATVVCGTDSPLSPVVPFTDHMLRIFAQSSSPFDSYTAGISLCNVLISAVAARNRRSVKESLILGDEIWGRFDIFTDRGSNG